MTYKIIENTTRSGIKFYTIKREELLHDELSHKYFHSLEDAEEGIKLHIEHKVIKKEEVKTIHINED